MIHKLTVHLAHLLTFSLVRPFTLN